ncbi:putative virus X resistance protein-like, coiled-coil [Helianthus annuus]|nr:putative virus X resistance protein-like, coiled-coil [Helianthus annuus]
MAVEAIVSVVLHNLTNLRIEESNIFKKVRDEVERVVMELREMQSILNEVEHQEQGDKVLTEWILKFLDIVYRVKDDIESFSLTETRLKNMGLVKKRISVTANKFKLCREVPDEMVDSMNVRRLKSKMNGISKEIQEWKEGKPSLALAPVQGSYAMNRDEQPWQESDGYYAPKKEETIFKKDVEKLVKQLTSNSKPLQIILVFGEVGTGKTAHVKTIYNKLEVKNKFPCHAFVILTTKCSIRYLMITILQQVTSLKAKDKLKDEDLMVKLNEFLKGQKYLIVVIDVKSSGLLKQLKDVLPDTNNGSRVVITTPDEEVASFPDATTHYHFKPLDMEDGLKFFIKKVWGVKGIPFAGDVIEDLKNKIAERCKGTPLRIIMLAGLLSTRKMMYEDIPVQSTRHRAPSQLQTLWGLFVDEKIARKIGLTLSRMTNLRKLDLTRQSSSTVKTTTITTATTTTTTTTCHSSSYEEIGLWISSLSSLPSLRLRSKDKMGRPSELIVKPFSSLVNLSQLYLLGSLHKSIDWYQMPPALKVLTLSVSHLEKDPMPTLSQLPSLIVLRLLAASYVGEEMCCPENGFPALQVLKLWKLERLKIWTAHGGTMPNLHTLDIRCCRELEEIPVTLLQIQSFENLILTNMPKQFVSGTRKKKKKHTKIVENE